MPDPVIESKVSPAVALILERLAERGHGELLWTTSGSVTAAEILSLARQRSVSLADAGVTPGAVCAFEGDYGPQTVALFLALAMIGAVAVPFTRGVATERGALSEVAAVEWDIDPEAGVAVPAGREASGRHPLVAQLASSGRPGLIVFSSGSTGRPKAILHDVDRVASKFAIRRPGRRLLMFLLMDHFGGYNTLMSVLANDSVGVCPSDRSPKAVCSALAAGRADVLPTTPTFLALLIGSGLWREADLSSIRLVTYGAEPMPEATLRRSREILPAAEFKQTYGLSELGVLRSSSPDQNSLWLRVGGEGFETRVVDGQLHIRSTSSMLGYLNAPTPIDEDGWMNTGDLVEEHDGLIRFLGRRSEMINVGGQKVLPTEIESVLLEADDVTDAIVHAIPHKLLGQAIVARVSLRRPEDPAALTERLRAHCRGKLQKYKVPMKFEVVDAGDIASPRAKKQRQIGER